MDDAQLAELGRLYDEYMLGDPKSAETRQAIFLYKALARDLYCKHSEEFRNKITFDAFIAVVLNPEVLAYLEKQQTPHPTITPEKTPSK